MNNTEGEGSKSLNQREHNEHAGAKRVIPRFQDPVTGDWSNAPLPFIDTSYDDIVFSNPDGGGNYQTIDFKSNTVTVRTLDLTFDASNNVTRITRN